MLDGRTGNILGLLDRFLNRADSLVQIDDDALARAARFGHAMAAIAQAVVGDLRHQHAGLGAAYINCRQKVFVLVRPCLSVGSCPLAIAGTWFLGLALH